MTDRDLPTRTEGEGETLDMPEGLGTFSSGQVLGERYQILEMLGRGGMGEVWKAFDLKLRVEVALKALRPEFFKSERRLELLRQEVRAAREVVSPNVCRIFDLIEVEGRELVSMEYVDGATLLGVLQEGGPLELKEAQDIASQFLAGLEAIHKVGLVHRDIKPENIMLTRAGRVVVMDFGLARQEAEGGGSVSGTPAYMAPEQAAGQALDARADVYAAGVVLAEMVSPDGIKSYESRQTLWEGVRSEPAKLPDSPWAPAIKKAVARDRERRYNTAHTLVRALEDVTLRVEGAEDLHPYPGLASFTEDDAEYFFGREAEVEKMWRKLEGPPRMLALVGPSGAGKTSFLQAGLAANAGAGWGSLICKPGNNPQLAMSRALAPELAGDVESMDLLLRFDDPEVATEVVSRWGRSAAHAVLIVDQFEELFTQNGAEEQRRFVELLYQVVLESDVHVLLSMRDDFLLRCHDHEALAPLFSDLTPLRAPTGGALRRALIQPATKCGYRFEDDDLVEEMLAEVEGERGALPLLAFAAARLWEKRNRETGLLTRQAYHDIGGVGGALARHAEATIDRIGTERIAHVRELFRNLVTAEGTRAVREWGELLSVFDTTDVSRAGINPAPTKGLSTTGKANVGEGFIPSREAAEDVLRELINARLLTSYEVKEEDSEPTRRVEIIHESLLANWPRLVRWQTQDADAVQLRDQLRQAAKTWNDQGRSDDTLWIGAAYREFASWQERYSGGLSKLEGEFAAAMTSLSTRRRRRRRIAVSAAFVVLVVVASVVGVLWQRSVSETRRAEAAGLLSQAQVELDSYPSAAVAYATASIELSDSQEARRLALEALWKGPTAFVVNEARSWNIAFTPEGSRLVQATDGIPHRVHVIGSDGSDTEMEDVHDGRVSVFADSTSGVFATIERSKRALWSAPEKKLLALEHEGYSDGLQRIYPDLNRRRLLLLRLQEDRLVVDALGFPGGTEPLGDLPIYPVPSLSCMRAPKGEWFAVSNGDGVHVIEIRDLGLSRPRRVDDLDEPVSAIVCDPRGRFVAARYEDGQIRLWNSAGQSPPKVFSGPQGRARIRLSWDGSLLEVTKAEEEVFETWIWSINKENPTMQRHVHLGKSGGTGGWRLNPVNRQIVSVINRDGNVRIWPLRAPADSQPIVVGDGGVGVKMRLAVHPRGQWMATSGSNGLKLWSVARSYPIVINRYQERVGNIVFGPEGRWLASSDIASGTVRLWQLEGDGLPAALIVNQPGSYGFDIAASPDGERLLQASWSGAHLISLEDDSRVTLPSRRTVVEAVAISPDGRYAAGNLRSSDRSSRAVRIWNVTSQEEVATMELESEGYIAGLQFADDKNLISSGNSTGLLRWNFSTGESETIVAGPVHTFSSDSVFSRVLFLEADGNFGLPPHGPATVLDLKTGTTTPLTSHGDQVTSVVMDASGRVVATGDKDGTIRVGSVTGDEPHLLLGNKDEVWDLEIDPKGRWIASASGSEVRLWPMPDLSKPPLHTLPHDELIAKLHTLTNLRVIRDEDAAAGWKVEIGPFPGWAEMPEW